MSDVVDTEATGAGADDGTIGVFVADDEETVVDVLRAVIATDPSLRFVGSANDADAAIAGVALAAPDVAVLDVRMPGGGGIHAAREIRRRELPTKIVALSAHEDADTIVAMVGVGADAYVPKADPTEKIVRAIHRVVDRGWQDDRTHVPPVLAPPLPQRNERAPRVARAILEGAVTPGFEPIVDVGTRQVVGVDVRPRIRLWPDRAYDGWLADAAAEGLLVDLELTAFRAALPMLQWLPDDVFVEVQITAATAAHPRFRRAVAALDRRIVLGFSALEVLSEDARDVLVAGVSEFRGRGIGISARDVGPGIEGLRQLSRLSPDHAWLDPTITRGLGHSFTVHSVAATVVACADEAGARVIADGVTSMAQLDELLALRVAMAAGPLLGTPLDRPEPRGDAPVALPQGPRQAGSRRGGSRADASGGHGDAGPRVPKGGRR
jgi:DNA-binding NarL/FixJ family response regulator